MAELATSVALHVTLFAILASVSITSPPPSDARRPEQVRPDVQQIVFLMPESARIGGGGGGGGNQQPGPIRRAQGVGSDAITLRTRRPAAAPVPVATAVQAPLESAPALPSIVLDAEPMASGLFEQIGLPNGGVLSGTSTGSGSGGGVGTGTGTGIGSGRGPGLGPGSGGGTGGGVYRPGGAVTSPRLVKQVKPGYTNEALLANIQGTVVLEVVVARDGCTSQIRVVRSLDPGLDERAVSAVAQWRFEPGRLAGTPVDVLVVIMLDFTIR